MALFEEVQRRLREQPVQPAEQQAGIEQVLRAKTGKAAARTTPAASRVGERSAMETVEEAAGAQRRQASQVAGELGEQEARLTLSERLERERLLVEKEIAESGMRAESRQMDEILRAREEESGLRLSAQEEMETRRLNQQYRLGLTDLSTQRNVAMEDLFAEAGQERRALRDRADAAQLEQLAHTLAMSDQAYVDELKRVGEMNRLDDAANFRRELARLTLGTQTTNLIDELGWRASYNGTQRDWEKSMSKMSIRDAIRLADARVAAANQQAVASGITELAVQGTKAYYSVGEETPEAGPGAGGGGAGGVGVPARQTGGGF